jgi:hypothetical protein
MDQPSPRISKKQIQEINTVIQLNTYCHVCIPKHLRLIYIKQLFYNFVWL